MAIKKTLDKSQVHVYLIIHAQNIPSINSKIAQQYNIEILY